MSRSATKDGRGARVYLTPEEILLLRVDLTQAHARYPNPQSERPHLKAKLKRAAERSSGRWKG